MCKEVGSEQQGSVWLRYQLIAFQLQFFSFTVPWQWSWTLQESLLSCVHLTEPSQDSPQQELVLRDTLCSCFVSYFCCQVGVSVVASGRQHRAPSTEWLWYKACLYVSLPGKRPRAAPQWRVSSDHIPANSICEHFLGSPKTRSLLGDGFL